ncbi:hypothetical protein [Actinoplanes sp. TFC3]|uniref:hypothetical protein n=1 Tax=Actinoplanes sp. TFC3 TaxID=1710355 RepID=UPI000834E69E|nr:hypothetical protein [Actinoplanes sp. TFC3]
MELDSGSDLSAADWLLRSGTPALQLLTFGPQGFEAYARLRFIPDPVEPGQDEADVEVADDHPSDLEQTRHALRVLSGFTTTPQDLFACLWDGYSDQQLLPGPRVELPYRSCALLRGFDMSTAVHPPAFVWPADRRWCFVSDVDPHWAGIGAGRAAIDALIADPRLDVVPADPAQRQPAYGLSTTE